jgi:hypothetical protein
MFSYIPARSPERSAAFGQYRLIQRAQPRAGTGIAADLKLLLFSSEVE